MLIARKYGVAAKPQSEAAPHVRPLDLQCGYAYRHLNIQGSNGGFPSCNVSQLNPQWKNPVQWHKGHKRKVVNQISHNQSFKKKHIFALQIL